VCLICWFIVQQQQIRSCPGGQISKSLVFRSLILASDVPLPNELWMQSKIIHNFHRFTYLDGVEDGIARLLTFVFFFEVDATELLPKAQHHKEPA
jgi:hypothetical protein